jgi:hypothetical protein
MSQKLNSRALIGSGIFIPLLIASSIRSFVRDRWAIRVISASVFLSEDMKKTTGSIATKNTTQNKNIFLYGSGFVVTTGTGFVRGVSIYPFSVAYFSLQCKRIEA